MGSLGGYAGPQRWRVTVLVPSQPGRQAGRPIGLQAEGRHAVHIQKTHTHRQASARTHTHRQTKTVDFLRVQDWRWSSHQKQDWPPEDENLCYIKYDADVMLGPTNHACKSTFSHRGSFKRVHFHLQSFLEVQHIGCSMLLFFGWLCTMGLSSHPQFERN